MKLGKLTGCRANWFSKYLWLQLLFRSSTPFSHPIFTSAELFRPLTRSPPRSSNRRPYGPAEGAEVPGRSPLRGREVGMTPPHSQVHDGPRGVLQGPSQFSSLSGRSQAEAVYLLRMGGNTHLRNAKDAAASPHSLPWHQVLVSRRVQRQRDFRVGSDRVDEGLRQVRRSTPHWPVPAPSSLLHSRPPIHHAPRSISPPGTPHHAPPVGLCPRPL